MRRVSAVGSIASIEGSALTLDTTGIAQHSASCGHAERDVILFVQEGHGTLERDGGRCQLAEGCAALIPAGEQGTVTTDTPVLTLVEAGIAVGVDHHAPMGAAEPVTRLAAVEADRATGARSFQVLYGPHNGSLRATLFVGYIPPGRAPWHYHLYDEIVWVISGSGRLHLRDSEPEPLAPGSAFRLRPREVHIVENLSPDEELAVLGLFTPAGSPSAAYLEPGVLAEYRIG